MSAGEIKDSQTMSDVVARRRHVRCADEHATRGLAGQRVERQHRQENSGKRQSDQTCRNAVAHGMKTAPLGERSMNAELFSRNWPADQKPGLSASASGEVCSITTASYLTS